MSRKAKGFFQHPRVMRTVQPESPSKHNQLNPEERSTVETKIIGVKEAQIITKRQILARLREDNSRLEFLANNYQSESRHQQQALYNQMQELDRCLEEVETQIASAQELEKIDVEEYIAWRHAEAKKIHFERIEELRKKYSEQNGGKIELINQLTNKVEQTKLELRELQKSMQDQKGKVVNQEKEEEFIMPNVRHLGAQLVYLREKVKSQKETKRQITKDLKEQLNSSTWPVRKTFEECKQRISKEMKRLIQYLDKPDKQVAAASPAKIPNPLTLIEAYETRLAQLQEILPEQLQTQQILKCLRPLPWRSIKGSGIDPSTSPTSEIQDKFNRMQKDFVDSEARHLQLKNSIKQKDVEIDKLLQLLTEMEQKIKLYRK